MPGRGTDAAAPPPARRSSDVKEQLPLVPDHGNHIGYGMLRTSTTRATARCAAWRRRR
ncbi:hypothetical protein GS475_03030 [Rhodococcus hoagii]|nr:hypothetical protein [Prescottella equi]